MLIGFAGADGFFRMAPKKKTPRRLPASSPVTASPFGGPTSGAAAAYGLTRSPFAQRGLPPPGYSGYGAGFDPELMRLLNGVHEATRALDDYLRFRGYI
jgi:hypothetical protein